MTTYNGSVPLPLRRQLKSKSTVVHRRDDLCRRPLRSYEETQQTAPSAALASAPEDQQTTASPQPHGRKRNMVRSLLYE